MINSSRLKRAARHLLGYITAIRRRARSMITRKTQPRFASAGSWLVIEPPYYVRNPGRMYLGNDVKIGPNSVLKAKTKHAIKAPNPPERENGEQRFAPMLRIGDRVTATAMLRVTVYHRVTIDDDVMLGANVYIADGTHCTRRGDVPYSLQGIDRVAPVYIGPGAWIGQNVVIMPGVTIGAMAVVGANSVVTRDVAAGFVVAGAPARPIRSWDAQQERWCREPRQLAARSPSTT